MTEKAFRQLNIDPEFKNLIRPLRREEYRQLELNLVMEGCREDIIAWNDTIVDGHNRYEICNKMRIPYVFNGQHTLEIVALASGSRETPVWCMIYDDLNYEHEADIFANQMKFVKPLRPYEVFMANVEAGNQEQLMIKDLVESYSLSIGQVRNYGVVCAVSTLENIYERFGYHVLDRTLRLCVGTWEGDMNSLSANMLNGIARLVYTFGDTLKDETFKEKVGEMSVKLLSRTAKERRPGSMGYAEAMLLAYNRKCKYPLKWTKLYEKNVGNNEGLDIDTDMDEDEGGDSFEGAAKE